MQRWAQRSRNAGKLRSEQWWRRVLLQHAFSSRGRMEIWENFGSKSMKTVGWSVKGFFDWPHDIRYTADKPAIMPGMMGLLVEYVLFPFSTCSSSSSSSPRSHSPNPHRDSRGLPANGVGSRYCTLCYLLEDSFVYLQFGEQVQKSGAQQTKTAVYEKDEDHPGLLAFLCLKKGKRGKKYT